MKIITSVCFLKAQLVFRIGKKFILALFLSTSISCNDFESQNEALIIEVLEISKKHGFEAKIGSGEGLDLGSLKNYEGFLKFIKNPQETENLWIAKEILSRISEGSNVLSESITKSGNYASHENLKILCLQNPHLVNARLPIIYGGVFPSYGEGGGLGVNFVLNIQNSSLANSSANTYGWIPLTGVVGYDIQLKSISGNQYVFFATYQLSYSLVIDGLTFYVTEPRYVSIRVDACTGETSVNVAFA
jgi:hypothetical protein